MPLAHAWVQDQMRFVFLVMKENPMIEFWTIESTGWSGGISWFHHGGTEMNPLRFKTYTPAIDYGKRARAELNQDTTLWRIVHTTIKTTDNSSVTTRTWTLL